MYKYLVAFSILTSSFLLYSQDIPTDIIILDSAVQDGKVMQDFELELLTTVGEHSHLVKAPTVVNDSGSKDCVNLPSSTAESRIIDKKQNYEANFSTSIFDQYFTQIAAEAKKLKNLPTEFKAVFLTPGETIIEKRLTHKKIVNMLRNALENDSLGRATKRDIEVLSAKIFTEIHIKEEHEKFLSNYIDLSDDTINSRPLHQLVLDIYAELQERFKYSDHFSEHTAIKDYHLEGFLPTQIYTIGSTRHLYTPNPFVEDKLINSITIDPIFQGYLRFLKSEKKKHLYINVAKVDETWAKLFQKEEFKNELILITVDRCSEFYYQKNEWVDKDDAHAFKENFKHHILTHAKYFNWPPKLLELGWADTVSHIIENIHAEYFHLNPQLTRVQRGAFIEIANAQMIAAVCEMLEPDFVNATCEFTMDRGPSQFALTYLYDILQKHGQLTTDEKRYFLTLFFVSPIIIHNRTSHDYRVQRLSETLDLLHN